MKKINQQNDNNKQDTKLFRRVKINHLFITNICSFHVKDFKAIFQSAIKKKRNI